MVSAGARKCPAGHQRAGASLCGNSGQCGRSRVREKEKNLEPGLPVLRQAVAAINRPAFCRLERNFAFLSTVRTGCFRHLAGTKVSGPSAATKIAFSKHGSFSNSLLRKTVNIIRRQDIINGWSGHARERGKREPHAARDRNKQHRAAWGRNLRDQVGT